METTIMTGRTENLIRDLADTIGTPFYLYDAREIRSRHLALTRRFPDIEFFYSLKANPNLSVVAVLVECGMGCEVSSTLEMETALAAGADPGKILVVGPGKSSIELARAVTAGVKAVVCESLEEVRRVDELAKAKGKVQPVAIRVNPDFRVEGAKLTMSGRPTQFGVDRQEIERVLEVLCDLRHVRLSGFHVYMGTRMLDHRTVAANTDRILGMVTEMLPGLSEPLDFVDVGGGFGVPYHEGESPLDLDALSFAVAEAMAGFRKLSPGTVVAMELGRYMVAESGVFVTRVRATKRNKGERFAVCDGGSNVHSAAAGQGFMRRNFPIGLVTARPGEHSASVEKWTVSGPLCTPTDVIAKAVELPSPRSGDLVCIHKSGAYGPTASPVNFLGFGAPAEAMLDGEAVSLVRRRPRTDDVLDEQFPVMLPQPSGSSVIRKIADPSDPFAHPVLDSFDGLTDLFERTGAALEDDPDDWGPLWDDPTVRALTTIGVPEEYNGFPLSGTTLGIDDCPYPLHVAIIERLARLDASCILALPGPSLSGGAVLAIGDAAQRKRFFSAYLSGPQGTFFAVTEPEAGSDAVNGCTVLVADDAGGMVLEGEKMLVGGPARAEIGLVFARLPGSGRHALVMVEPSEAGRAFAVRRLSTSGLCGADLCQISINGLRVIPEMVLGAEAGSSLRDGFLAINGVFERNRPVVAALALGNARAILDRLGSAARFDEMKTRHAVLLERLASVVREIGEGRPRGHRISEIKMRAVAFSDDVASAVPAFAPRAFAEDGTLRRKCRDSKAFEYMEGTTNIHLLNAFRSYAAGVPS